VNAVTFEDNFGYVAEVIGGPRHWGISLPYEY
jgi:hypothetical protein